MKEIKNLNTINNHEKVELKEKNNDTTIKKENISKEDATKLPEIKRNISVYRHITYMHTVTGKFLDFSRIYKRF